MKERKVALLLPAHNAARTFELTWAELPKNGIDIFILVDDGSRDRTVEIARHLGISVVLHVENKGYGANQKAC